MARIARKYNETNFFHVIVQGLNKEYIFKEERYIKYYLKLLFKNKENTNIQIIAHCIMNNHAHLVLYTESISEMSKYMQKVNTLYAKYYNYMNNGRVGYVFRDRYVSEAIKNEKYLIDCINYVHLNPVRAGMVKRCEDYEYSSYKQYMNENQLKLLAKLVGIKFDITFFKDINAIGNFCDIDKNIEEIVNENINDYIVSSNMNKNEILLDNFIIKKIIKYLKNCCNIKYTDMMSVLGITRGRMMRLKQ